MALNKNAKAWVKALRGRRFKQAKHYLYAGSNQYCCLGVACKLYQEQHKLGKTPSYLKVKQETCLPDEVMDWLGLADHEGCYVDRGDPDCLNHLTNLNDNKGFTFKQIAAVIESEPEGLFVE
jgi:hypothetical protein